MKALYFSRAAIPHIRSYDPEKWIDNRTFYKHIGIYAYRTAVLSEIVKLPMSYLEISESLEQLRWIENGFSIQTVSTELESIAVDTPGDLSKIFNKG